MNLWTHELLCTNEASYLAFYEGCTECPGPACEGAPVCVDHAVHERKRASKIGLMRLQSIDATVLGTTRTGLATG